MKKIIFVGKISKSKNNTFKNGYTNLLYQNNISNKVVFRTSGIGKNYEIYEMIAPNGIKYRKYILL